MPGVGNSALVTPLQPAGTSQSPPDDKVMLHTQFHTGQTAPPTQPPRCFALLHPGMQRETARGRLEERPHRIRDGVGAGTAPTRTPSFHLAPFTHHPCTLVFP